MRGPRGSAWQTVGERNCTCCEEANMPAPDLHWKYPRPIEDLADRGRVSSRTTRNGLRIQHRAGALDAARSGACG